MAARNKEICVLLLDVGPFMHPALTFAAKAASAFVLSKILNKLSHEVAVVYYGTADHNNKLQQEMAEQGDADQYTCICVQHELQPPDSAFLLSFNEVPKGTGRSDCIDALTVAVDCIYRSVEERPALGGAKKRITMISNFLHQAAGDENDPFLDAIVDRLNEKDIMLEIISIDVPEQDGQQQQAKDFNAGIIKRIMQQSRHKFRSVSQPIDLLGSLSTREYAHTAYYSGPLSVGNMMNIKVKVCKKTSKQTLPSMGNYSDRSRGDNATHQVQRETEYKAVDNPEEPVPPEERVKAYKYGRQAVPISEADEKSLSYSPEKCFELIGFVDTANHPPRHYYMKDTWVVAPEKDNSRAQLALSAIGQAMLRTGKHGIARFVPRANGAVQMGVLTPCLQTTDDGAASAQPHCLWMNMLPFTEDIRTATFASFDQSKRGPSQKQLDAMQNTVKCMHLSADQHAPDTTVNPLLLRFATFIASLVVDPANQVPEQDAYTASIVKAEEQPELQHLSDTFPFKAGHAVAKKRAKDAATQEQQSSKEDIKEENLEDSPANGSAEVKDEPMPEADHFGPVVTQKVEPQQNNATVGDFDDMD